VDNTKDEMINECESVIQQLDSELRALVSSKWDNDRKLFSQKKKLVIILLKTLLRDIKDFKYR
jgi:hypothetical protein